jgi:hemolysin-activating ACP:hemolysin acyltransferase
VSNFDDLMQDDALESAPEESGAAAPAELAQKVHELRRHLQMRFAKVVMTMMATPRYEHCSLADLEHLVLDPLLRNQIAIAQTIEEEGAARSHDDAVVGIAIRAQVSPDVDAKIREQIKAGVFPIRLMAQDWESGDIAWLLDVIAPSQQLAAAVLANFKQVAGEGRLFVHPVVHGTTEGQGAAGGA